ncbi:hypothetical protein GH714_017337 [Hevea brasiliensis]|uniref:NB-ARC domain-containing protein n=1 Tax=Hevea brasiliensis TaxID=3981 RepID=A0A6A6NA59_HEVBR|nr:hypothetical protein GH714_017337 [Hevea brasiliensis]
MEEVGDEYFQDLVSRSFFQRSNVHPSLFIMHDLLSDLAKVVSGEFCFRLEGDDSSKISQRTRHLSYGRTKKFEAITEAKLLRTFLPVERSRQWKPELIDIEVTHNLLPMLKYLRVLSLSKYQCIAELPNSIGNLKHLRFLNLSKTSITNLPDTVSNLFNLQMLTLSGCNGLIMLPDSIGNLKHLRYFNLSETSIRRLPESTCSLYALQTLILRRCKKLVVLPTNMGRLINLKHFDIRETNLREMPPQMGKLTKLKKLTDFVLGEQGGSRIKELRELQDLRGELCIRNLQNIVDSQEAIEADLKPHKHLSYLSIVGFGASRFPNWVGDHSFSNLLSLKLSGSKRCLSLPPLGQLVSLQDLSITAFDKVEIVGSEFYGRSRTPKKKPFCSLKILRFEKIPQWQEWISYAGEDEEGGAFPLLQELSVKKCPKLIKALPIQLPSLSALEIEGCHQLVDSFPNAPTILKMKFKDSYRDVQLQKLTSGLYSLRVDRFHSLDSLLERLEQIGCLSTNLEEIVMTNCNSLLCFPIDVFPRLKSLHISRCPNLECVFAAKGILVNFSPLSSLEIGECSKLVHFLEGGLPFPNLTRLRLWGCSNLKSLSECMHTLLPSLVNMEIDNCQELESFPVEGLPFKLRSLHIESCNKLIAACKQRNSQLPHSLQCFSIGRNEDLESFPEDKLLPSTLTSLRLWNLENLKFLDCRGLQRLTSLRELKIWKCPNLESMPEEGLPSTLFTLKIGDLQNLKSWIARDLNITPP